MKKIAIIGSPGVGKTTLSNGLFYFLKIAGINVEIVPELVKYKVYKGMNFEADGFDVLNTLEQKDFEEIFDANGKNHKLDLIICEAPLCNGYFYSSFYNKELEFPILKKIAKTKINTYDIILFVKRINNDNEYMAFGRNETLQESKKLENFIFKEIKKLNYKGKLIEVNKATDIKKIIEILEIKKEKK